MKVFHGSYPFSPLIAGLVLMAGWFTFSCHGTYNQSVANTMVTDSLLAPTGNAYLDSLLHIAATAEQDTNLVELYYEIGWVYADSNHEKAKEYFLKMKSLSEKLKWRQGHYLFARGFTEILNREGFIDSSIVIHQQALAWATEEADELQIALISGNLGNCYNYKNWYETALKYYNNTLSVFEKQGDSLRLAHLYHLMAMVYFDMNIQDENLVYSEKALDILKGNPDVLLRAHALINYSLGLLASGQLQKAEEVLLEAQRIYTLHRNNYFLMKVYDNLASLSLRRFDWDRAEMYLEKAFELATEFGDVEGCCISNRGFGIVALFRKNFDKSEEYTKIALQAAHEYGLQVQEMRCYRQLLDISTARHDFISSRNYAAKSDSIANRLMSESALRAQKEMEVKYETEKKETQIASLKEERRLMIWLSMAGGGLLLLAWVAVFLLWQWTIQKRRFAESHIKQLEQEKQLVATQAVFDGEVQERSRLARDLHDGLGGKLTNMKLNLQVLQKETGLEDSREIQLRAVLDLLDESVKEMRRVSHNLMPDALSRSGLKTAVDDFCRSMSPIIVFRYYGDESHLDMKLEAMIYRSIYELVNNALKHAAAAQIMVQIVRETDRLSFTVQDNGCGFDPDAQTEGIGLRGIRSRVASFGGEIQIDSKVGEGTEINVELRIEN